MYKYCYSGFLLVNICMEYFFIPIYFSLCMSLDLKWISCRQHIYDSIFVPIQLTYFFLVQAFNQFTFKVNYQYVCCYWDFLNFFGFIFLGSFSSLSLLFSSLMIWWLILVLHLGYIFCVFVCATTENFQYVVTIRF